MIHKLPVPPPTVFRFIIFTKICKRVGEQLNLYFHREVLVLKKGDLNIFWIDWVVVFSLCPENCQ